MFLSVDSPFVISFNTKEPIFSMALIWLSLSLLFNWSLIDSISLSIFTSSGLTPPKPMGSLASIHMKYKGFFQYITFYFTIFCTPNTFICKYINIYEIRNKKYCREKQYILLYFHRNYINLSNLKTQCYSGAVGTKSNG